MEHVYSIANNQLRVQCKIYALVAYTCAESNFFRIAYQGLRTYLAQPSPDFIIYFFAIERIFEFFSLTRIRNLLNNRKDAKAWV